MASWQKIEADAINFRQAVIDQERVVALERAEERRIARELEAERADEILKRFHVREVLEAIRDEVWQEGKITDSEAGAELRSTFRTVFVGVQAQGIELITRQPYVRIYVVPKIQLLAGEPALEPYLQLAECDVYGYKSYQRDRLYRQPIVEDLVRAYGWHDGIDIAVETALRPIDDGFWSLKDVDKPNAPGQFAETMVSWRKAREFAQATPLHMRERAEGIIHQLSGYFRNERTWADGRELQLWENQLRGIPKRQPWFMGWRKP